MVKLQKFPPVDEMKVRSLLEKYSCPVPYHEVRARFMGNIASLDMRASPISAVKALWGGELPQFESMEAVNELLDILVNGLWNSLTRHQKRSDPFRLVRTLVEPTRDGLTAYALTRQQEIDGFVEGLFNGEDSIELPEKAYAAVDILGEMRALLGGLHALVTDETKPASDRELTQTLRNAQQLTPIIEREIASVLYACKRARREMLSGPDFSEPTMH